MRQKIKLHRSQTLGKRVLATSLEKGELFLNYHRDSPGLYFPDNSSPIKLRKVGSAHVGVNPPNNFPLAGSELGVSEGELWYVTDPTSINYENLMIYVAGAWKPCVSFVQQV